MTDTSWLGPSIDVRPVLAEQQVAFIDHLLYPKQHVSIDPETQGGQPVITGTRVPFDVVAELMEDGIPPEKISDYYPGVTADAARDAASFALYVDSYGTGSRSA
ncbi:DUF433 domain-containing protein [Actinoallomurus sp. NPDC050550]|uniref:DUF433 domain-containing protein n=1 Tax=Actinoallomurus sp. NPDC050550 TaxID=3154937 RepID=UPI0033FE895E